MNKGVYLGLFVGLVVLILVVVLTAADSDISKKKDVCALKGMVGHWHTHSPVFCIDEDGRVFLFSARK